MNPPPLLSTSWDDGDPADLRLAEKLAQYGIRGTFYICRSRDGHPRLSDRQIQELAVMPGVEIGSHTLTHPDLRRLARLQIDRELRDSKTWLEDLIGEPVTSFCYPNGSHRRSLAGRVAAAGYSLGRTTMSGCTDVAFDPLLMPTTMQLYSHGRLTQVRHALKECNFRGLRSLLAVRRWSRRPQELARGFVERAANGTRHPVIHVWGHSWELNEANLWPAFEDLLMFLRDVGTVPATNRDLAVLAIQERTC